LRSRQTTLLGAIVVLATLLLPAGANAQLFRTYLASDGNDAGPCSLMQPCRLLPAALAAVANGGEIWMLDSANYNTAQVNITKSVTILAVPGALGSVVASGGNAIEIATIGVSVALRNLVIVPLPGGGGTGGINMTAGTSLAVENCLLANLPGNGINVTANFATVRITDSIVRGSNGEAVNLGGGAKATITRATIVDNGGRGVHITTAVPSTTTEAYILNSTISGNFHGVVAFSGHATAHVKMSVKDSMIARNNNQGMISQGNGATVLLSVSNSAIAGNSGAGIVANAGGLVWASGNTISDNASFGLNASGGTIETAGNNSVRNNAGGDTAGAAITAWPQK
jgi:hypothetical protein